MREKLRKILPHVAIVLCNMYIVFFCIDRVNTAMQFINNSITKALLLILCVISTINASFLILEERKKEAARSRRQSAQSPRNASARTITGATHDRTASARGRIARSTATRSPASEQQHATRAASRRSVTR